MAWTLYQQTLTANATQLIPPTGGVNVLARQVIIQNNAAASMRIGDNTVSATKGIYLAAGPGGGSLNSGAVQIYNSYLSDFWAFGTSGNVVDIFVNT
jgi:hypothetical protein